MRFVAMKSERQQAAGLVFRTRDLLVRQRTQLINAIRGHLTEYGWIARGPPREGAWLEVGDERFNSSEIQRLYEADDYPLRKPE
jgi:transposase